MSTYSLTARGRTITGKKVKKLRASGVIPATVYGKTTSPLTVSVNASEFQKVSAEAGETGLINLTCDGKKHPVLIHLVHIHQVDRSILNVEFHEVNLKEKVRAEVPLEYVGTPKAVKEKIGVFLSLIDHIDVEALPTDLPEKIPVDVSGLSAIDEQVIVGELAIPSGATLLTDPTLIIAKIGPFVFVKEPEPAPAATVESMPSEGEVPAEGATPEEKPVEAAASQKTPPPDKK